MLSKLKLHFEDSFKVDGDIIDFRIYDGSLFSEFMRVSADTGKKVIGLDTFVGLPAPNAIDMKHPHYNEIQQGQYFINETNTRTFISGINVSIDYDIVKTDFINFDGLSELYCFAYVDLRQYTPTKNALNYVWDHINYGGTIFIPTFDETQDHAQIAAVKEFLAERVDDISISRQMLVNGTKEKFIAIKCFNQKFLPANYKEFHTKKKVTIATVLKTGGAIYDYKYVNALAKSVKANVTVDHEFVVLTNDATGFSSDVDRVVKFTHDFPTWWGKVELFNPAMFDTDHVFYMDLDTVVIGNIDHMVSYDGEFAGLRDFFSLHSLGSGVMAWEKSKVSRIYERFLPKSKEVMNTYQAGDQVWIDENKPSIEWLQDVYHGEIVSYKRHCLVNNMIEIPKNAKIVCFHGNPRPHTIHHEILKQYW